MVVSKFILSRGVVLGRMAFETVVLSVVLRWYSRVGHVGAVFAPWVAITHAGKAIGQPLGATKMLNEEFSRQYIVFWFPVNQHGANSEKNLTAQFNHVPASWPRRLERSYVDIVKVRDWGCHDCPESSNVCVQ